MASKPRIGATVNTEPSMTRQADAESCDVNNIMKRYERTGVLPPFATPGFFGDVSRLGDFHAITEVVRQTTEVFMQLPAKTRFEFGNDVANFVNWASDGQNADALADMINGAEKAPVVPAASGETPPDAPPGA